ncbi:MAG TPA: TetR/AcrR family transcriptional regulator [Beutenbergiaceae bacterium]|nr:TetR/AcrR family transcriptional regulator [Beutenbergiaceae bacterium]
MLLEAAAQVFQREGLGATTNRIAERAGYSIGTLYQYFGSKQALLYALAERHLHEIGAALDHTFRTLRAESPTWEQTVRRLVTCVVGLHRDHARVHTLMHDYAPRAPELVARFEELREQMVAELAFHLDRCGRGGPDPQRTAALLFHTGDGQLHGVLLADEHAERELTRSLLALS